ncbi:restriction endonuclease [Pseudoxanthomonas koreensis]|uniref:restriction endonuclease n=1 Tax=Pseudoxanthomonas koreensis TaxID=266061 RepID=UPI001390BEC0|nr:restriction endonuclease [Pseudoxanthomonas koreensis]KAF1697733.1 hypothetical protein CSC64_00550 [Pseudoxanthomonas koreensis]
MSSWILGLALAVLAAVLAVIYLWLVRRPETETAAGLRALANLRWREFATLIAQAMQQRGLRDASHGTDAQAGADSSNSQLLLMTDGDSRCLLSCKHGMAYRLRSGSVDELAGAMDLAGARSGILLTEGRAEREALSAAAERGIEVIDGRRLWPLLKPYMPADTTRRIVNAATAQAKRHTFIALGGALVLGLLVAVVLPQMGSGGEPAPAAPVVAGEPAAGPAAAKPAAAIAAEADDTGTLDADPDDETLARYQGDIARAVTGMAGVSRAYWLTRATLVVDRIGSEQVVWPQICAELERYPALRTVRVQLNPRPDSEDKVRWRQCRTM